MSEISLLEADLAQFIVEQNCHDLPIFDIAARLRILLATGGVTSAGETARILDPRVGPNKLAINTALFHAELAGCLGLLLAQREWELKLADPSFSAHFDLDQ